MSTQSTDSRSARFVPLLVAGLALAHCARGDDPGIAADGGVTHRDASRGSPGDAGLVEQGRAYVAARHCGACHESADSRDGTLSGSVTPIPGAMDGVVGYGPNLTPDEETGLGAWTDQQIVDAIRLGVDDQGEALCVMPEFATMSDAEAAAIVAYLRSLPPVARTVGESTCPWDLDAGERPVDPATDAGDDVLVTVSDPDGGATEVDGGLADADSAVPEDGGVVTDGGSCAPVVVINELQTGGAGGAGDEFVELLNASDCEADLAGYELKYASATGTSASRRWVGVVGDVLPPHGYAIVAGLGFTGSVAPLGVFASAGGVLSSIGGGIGLYAPSGTRIDSVGYGTATNALVEGTTARAPASAHSIARSPDGRDTDHNRTDFAVATTPTPGAANRGAVAGL